MDFSYESLWYCPLIHDSFLILNIQKQGPNQGRIQDFQKEGAQSSTSRAWSVKSIATALGPWKL